MNWQKTQKAEAKNKWLPLLFQKRKVKRKFSKQKKQLPDTPCVNDTTLLQYHVTLKDTNTVTFTQSQK
jgi:hypothetical protein